jgi:predicted enzyme related to lactoylglutathione lyase
MNKVVHFEIPVDDVKRAQDFYSKIFGWKINVIPNMDYTIVHTGPTDEKDGMLKESGFINGGMMKRSFGIKNLVITIDVEDIEAAISKAVSGGGKMIRGKTDVGDMGYSAYIEDTEGNIIGLWQNKPKKT